MNRTKSELRSESHCRRDWGQKDLCNIKAVLVVPAGEERQHGGPGREDGLGEKKQGRESINTNFI